MNKNFNWYLDSKKTNERYAYIDDVFNPLELEAIIKLGLSKENAVHEKAAVESKYDGRLDEETRVSDISWLYSDNPDNSWVFQKITSAVNDINNQFFQFDLTFIENLQFTIYHTGYFYKRHIDLMYNSFAARKLSFSLLLNDPASFNGGDLVFHIQPDPLVTTPRKGRIYFFPSYNLHEVLPVTSGTRYALVGWVAGPNFK